MVLNDIIKNCPGAMKKVIRIVGNIKIEIDGLNLCNRESEKNCILSYVTSDKYVQIVENKKHIKALVARPEDESAYRDYLIKRNGVMILSENPEILFYELHEYLYHETDFYDKYDFESVIGENCNISDSAVIERGVIIGNNVTVGHLSVIRHGTVIDDNVTIGCNTTIGSEGFQLIANGSKPPLHVSHAGGCYLCNGVYIGDNSCVCNSLFEGKTYIGENVKIDNLVHIAHNLYIEKNAVITAHVIACGSSRIEEGAWIAPNVSIINGVIIGKYAKVGLGSVVTKDVPAHSVVYGNPAREHK